MQFDPIITLAQAVRLLAFHVGRLNHDLEVLAELQGIRNDMVELIQTFKPLPEEKERG